MTVAVNDIVDKAEIILQDTTNTRWPASELIGWLNDAQLEIVLQKPEASITNESVAMTAGTKQSLPASGIQLIDVIRNMGAGGATPGNAIRIIDRKILDAQVPDWHLTAGAAAVIEHYMFDERDPENFYVYPPSDATTQIEIVYSSAPTTVTAGQNISLADVYANCILDYILYRAYSKDADYAANSQRAVGHFKAFMTSLGKRDQVEVAFDPNTDMKKPQSMPVGFPSVPTGYSQLTGR
jgi:hypothetical protein